MRYLFLILLLGTSLLSSSCFFLINTAIYGSNCETCVVRDFWGEVQWCTYECLGQKGKDEMYAECEAYAAENGGDCSCFMGEPEEDDMD